MTGVHQGITAYQAVSAVETANMYVMVKMFRRAQMVFCWSPRPLRSRAKYFTTNGSKSINGAKRFRYHFAVFEMLPPAAHSGEARSVKERDTMPKIQLTIFMVNVGYLSLKLK